MKLIIVFSQLFLLTNVFAQSIEEIKSDGEYYYGSGISEVYQEASDMALKELTSQISVRVSSSLESKVTQTNKKFDQTVESILNTYSMATLKNVQTIKRPVDKGIEVFYEATEHNTELYKQEEKLRLASLGQKA